MKCGYRGSAGIVYVQAVKGKVHPYTGTEAVRPIGGVEV